MKKVEWLKYGALLVMLAGAIAIYQRVQAQQQPNSNPSPKQEAGRQEAGRQEAGQQKVELPEHPAPPGGSDGKDLVVQLCDGETNLVLEGVEPGTRLSPKQAKEASNRLMAMWYAKTDPLTAKAWQQEAAAAKQKSKGQTSKTAGSQGSVAAPTAGPATGRTEQVNDFTVRDYSVWKRELEREVAYGNQIFHDDKLVGSTNGVACAMCHPNGANTHPESYPKFQIQLRRVSLLRDMINWCIENPSRGKKLDADDPKMRALEAYIMAQRKGVAMEYGKH